MREVFLDIETTGLSFKDKHKIVEIACVETDNLISTKNIFHKLVNPQRDVPDEAYNVHGHSTEKLKSKQTFDEIAKDLLDFIKDKKIIIHNARFDVGFLNNELGLLNLEQIKFVNVVDTLELARNKYPGTSNSLDALCRRFNIDLSKRGKHNALLDCQLLREVYINILDLKEPKLIFSNDKIDENKIYEKNNKVKYSKKIIYPDKEELEKHKKFIRTELKKNFY
jgi:DNA polymerase-3 subunit epsilon